MIFVNATEFGGSRIYARGERAIGWFAGPDGTEPLPKGTEALVTADVRLGRQYEIRKATNESSYT